MKLKVEVVQATGQGDELLAELQVVQEPRGQAGEAVVGAGHGTGHGRDGVRVVPGVHRGEQGGLEAPGGGRKHQRARGL